MNYDNMSDFEINNYVAFSLGILVKTEYDTGMLGFTEKYHAEYPNNIWAAQTDDLGNQSGAWGQVNFCAIPEQSWPVIVDNKIAVMPDSDGTWKAGNLPDKNTVGWSNFTRGHSNPLRAAMICYLKMQEE